jgi:hypothetical protein
VTAHHPTAADLFSFSAGTLSRSDHAEIENHIQTCSHCLNILTLLPDAPLTKRARRAVKDVSVHDSTPLPEQPLKKVAR